MLARELRIAERRDAQEKREWKPLESGTLAERRVGILGTGSIGGHIASVLSGFCAEVRGLNRSGRAVEHFDRTMTADHRDEFLAGLDYVIAVLPDTPESTNLLDATAFSVLPDHAVVINVGRSNVIDHDALVRALEENRLGGAVLDVFDEEPLPPESPLWTTPGLLITAHMAARTMPADVAPVFIENARRFLDCEPLKFEIDFDRGY
jgi:phosphoglycerate dehydrogenase-like enzyme